MKSSSLLRLELELLFVGLELMEPLSGLVVLVVLEFALVAGLALDDAAMAL